MKKLFLIAVSLMFLTDVFAQKDVTKFLGIPVDGTKSEMIRQLKAKGYTSSPYNSDVLVGEFNGRKVNIHVVTNNNKVYRIMVADANCENETDIRIHFNRLCEQFKNNERYVSIGEYTIPDSEDISYEMSVKKKRYEAAFYQKPIVDSTMMNDAKSTILSQFSDEQLANPSDDFDSVLIRNVSNYFVTLCSNKSVWFMIYREYGKYKIVLFYDNVYNQANGEDL